MKFIVSENIIKYHEIEMSDELDMEDILYLANKISGQYDSAYEALQSILEQYKIQFGDAFDFNIKYGVCGDKNEGLTFEYFTE